MQVPRLNDATPSRHVTNVTGVTTDRGAFPSEIGRSYGSESGNVTRSIRTPRPCSVSTKRG